MDKSNFKYYFKDTCIKSEVEEAVCLLQKFLTPTLVDEGININEYAFKIHRSSKVILVKDNCDVTIGIAAVYMNDTKRKTAYLTLLIICDKMQGCGIGHNLLTRLEAYSEMNGMNFMRLEVKKQNANAILFYKNHEYEIESETDNTYYMIKKFYN